MHSLIRLAHPYLRELAVTGVLVRSIPAVLAVCIAISVGGCQEAKPSRDELLETVRAQQAADEFESGVAPLREFLGDHPDDAEANYYYGRALSMTEPHLALWSLRKATEDPEWFVRASMQLALVALTAHDFNAAIEIASQILERQPENLRARMLRANAYAHSKIAPDLAIADAERMLEINPDALEAYEPLILGLVGSDRLEEARAALELVGQRLQEMESQEAQFAWHCATLGTFQQESGQLEEARATFESCVRDHPLNLDVVSSAGHFFDASGERDRTDEILRAGLAEEPTSRFFRLTLAQRLAGSGHVDEAEALLLEAAESDIPAAAATAWVDLGKLRQRRQAWVPAVDALEKAVEIVVAEDDPSAPWLQFEFADALVLASQLDRAMEVANGLENAAHRHLIRGRVLQEQRQPAAALAEFDEVIQRWPDNPWARYYAALAAEEVGDFERAMTEFRNSVRIDPAATDARTRAAALLLAGGNATGAQVVLRTDVGKAPLGVEGLLLSMRLAGLAGDSGEIAELLETISARDSSRVGDGLASAADGLALRGGPALAVNMLAGAPVDLEDPRNVEALRALVRHAHRAAEIDARRSVLYEVLDERPRSSAFQSVRALDLQLSGAPAEEVGKAYSRAVELDPQNVAALAGLGAAELRSDPHAALDHFDRASALDPLDPAPKLGAARALIELGKADEASARLDALLVEHPHDANAAYERALLDLEGGALTDQTLERARRAARFGGGDRARELLGRVREELDKSAG
jgi:tetratricopeptide (TPR) repeat protein